MSRFQVINGSLMPIAGMQIADPILSETSEHPVQNKLVTDFINDQVNILGAKNLIPYPYYSGASYINNGITFIDTNGIITANGTATGTAAYHVSAREVGLGTVLKAGTRYKLTGCPIGGSDSTYYMYINGFILGTETNIEAKVDYGEGVEFSFDDDVIVGVWIRILEGVTANNLIFKPMLRPASIKDDIWTPYAMDNIALTSGLLQVNNLLQVKEIPITWTKPSGVYMDYNDRQSYCFLCGKVGILFFAARIGLPEADTFYDVASIPAQYIKSFYDRKSSTVAMSYNQVGIIQNNAGKPLPSSGYWCVRLNTLTGIISTSCTVAASAANNRFVVATIIFACN